MNTTVGHLIKRLRIEKGLNQTQLGALCGVSQTTIGAWERGENSPTPENLVVLAKALDVEPSAVRSQVEQLPHIRLHKVENNIVRESTPARHPYSARQAFAEKFEHDVALHLEKANVMGRWRVEERAPNGIRWLTDYQSEKVVVDFKCVDARLQTGLLTGTAATLWHMTTLQSFLKDSRIYAVIIFSIPDGDMQHETGPDLLGDTAARQPKVAARLHRLQQEAALVGISIYVVETAEEAAEVILSLENVDGDDSDLL